MVTKMQNVDRVFLECTQHDSQIKSCSEHILSSTTTKFDNDDKYVR